MDLDLDLGGHMLYRLRHRNPEGVLALSDVPYDPMDLELTAVQRKSEMSNTHTHTHTHTRTHTHTHQTGNAVPES